MQSLNGLKGFRYLKYLILTILQLEVCGYPPGKSLLLVGGDININGGGLYAFGGRIELGGLRGVGKVGLNSDGNNFSLSFPSGVERSDVTLNNSARVNVRAGDGGSIAVNARNLEMTGGSALLAGIDAGLGDDGSRAGNIDINVTDAILLNDGSFIGNGVRSQATGQGADVNILTSALLIENGAAVDVSTFGAGKGGNLNVDAQDIQLIGTTADGRFRIVILSHLVKGEHLVVILSDLIKG